MVLGRVAIERAPFESGGKRVKVRIHGKSAEVVLLPEKEELLSDLEEVFWFAVYCYTQNLERAYLPLGKSEFVAASRTEDGDYILYRERFADEGEKVSLLETIFEGFGYREVELALEEVRKAHAPSSAKEVFVLAGAVVFALGVLFVAYRMLFVKPKPKTANQPPPPLTATEVEQAKRVLTLRLVERLREWAEGQIRDPLIRGPIGVRVREVRLDWRKERDRLSGELSLILEYAFPARGTQRAGSRYQKTETFSESVGRANLKPLPGASLECVRALLDPARGEVISRGDDRVAVDWTAPAEEFFEFAETLFKKCPAHMERLSLEDGRFKARVVLRLPQEAAR
ncbi:hypothetical protein [Thermosulfurimonas sp. F29]|uniref:hypothetical protein n=1 Tax=Thermosulfurimonas sp. F29 TaxID=2867247 RepID=UPI001C83950E|nr:hypothetical protein [Thermosulfurimonas sp. F29]MBX6424113.1 hypothetical protein [Thermosulfurimonas sp. F29]